MTKNVKVKVFPAGAGESILISFSGVKRTNILIDCGYVSTYKTIKKELIKLKSKGECIDLLVLTHIDNDHINGARGLLNDYINGVICDISEIWINDYFRIFGVDKLDHVEISKNELNLISELNGKNYPIDNMNYGEKNVGYKDSHLLVNLLSNKKLQGKVNKTFNGGCVKVSEGIVINDEINISVISPTEDILVNLLEEWRLYLKSKGFGELSKYEEIAKSFELFYINNLEGKVSMVSDKNCSSNYSTLNDLISFDQKDKTLINRSSIAFIVEFENQKFLFLGDSSPKDYDEMLKGLYHDNNEDKIDFELVKISHHGSKFNTSSTMFDYIKSRRYLISTNGNLHRHPDLETIYKIIFKQNNHKDIYFNYKSNKVLTSMKTLNIDKIENKPCFDIKYENNNKMGRNILTINI
ncbi:MBL fold hydrolase [Paraclostridium bifermentans]|uniref:MBL fold metallo-hydrolase n=1 Tax=Paraclostridium bifermentans TaxID=1490 RepID=UPI0021C43B03|nr:MBL fold metallo-hydrolase [Paraclostridium bifermentans]GKZ02646.1 MBL fold hydrolase [Paraclostridium bifermentans]GKZ07415.1 MBL fold hydrolase [Paraclostridium bifermentans]GKZ09926.1 MBL fold hydrolase [Paraclostridium bifermentans]